ncbi:hypothetical protein HK103_003399, partial [Boothiomyces macroporosus]
MSIKKAHFQYEVMHIVKNKHASFETKVHCVYAFLYQGFKQSELAKAYGKAESTISEWTKQYFEGKLQETPKRGSNPRVIMEEERQWIVAFYDKYPTAYLHEAVDAFNKVHYTTISSTSIWRVLNDANYTHKKLERRAFEINKADINRYMEELNLYDWAKFHLVFLDEVSFDNQGMLRSRGYALK